MGARGGEAVALHALAEAGLTVPGGQNMPAADRRQVWATSDAVLAELGGDVPWAHSDVVDDKIRR